MDGESPSFSVDSADVGKAAGSILGSVIGSALGPVGAAVGGFIGGKGGEAAGGAVGGKGGSAPTSTASAVDDFSLPYGPGSASPTTAPGSMPDVVASLSDSAPGAGGDMGVINRTDPPPPVTPPAPPSITAPAPEAPPSITVQEPVSPAAAPAAPAGPAPVTPATLAANRGPVRVVRGRGARRLLLYDAQSGMPSVLGG